MKRIMFLLATTLILIILLTGCPQVVIETPTHTGQILVTVVEYMTGPVLSGAEVLVSDNNDNLLGTGVTNTNGEALLNLEWFDNGAEKAITILVKKDGFAPSVVEGFKIVGTPFEAAVLEILEVEMAANQATINPEWDSYPNFEVIIKDGDDNLLDTTSIATDFTVEINFIGENEWETWDVLYAGLGYIPWAQARDLRSVEEASTSYTFPLAGNDGIVPLHVVVYDHNRARVDRVIPLNFVNNGETQLELYAPVDLFAVSWTRPIKDIAFYGGSKLLSKLPVDTENHFSEASKDSFDFGNIFTEIDWTLPDDDTGIVGFNVYRSADGENFNKIAFRNTNYAIDNSIGLETGKEYFYKVRSVYEDGSESADSDTISVVPLEAFDVKLLSPANRETDVARRPTFRWVPTMKGHPDKAPVLGGGLIDEAEIYYGYQPWIYDTNLTDGQHIFPINDLFGEFFSYGPETISMKFLDPFWLDWAIYWAYITPETGMILYPFNSLEAYKTYEWGLDYAYAYYEDEDSLAISIASDLGYGLDPFGEIKDEYYNRFTTGIELE